MVHIAYSHYYLHIILVPALNSALESGKIRDMMYERVSEILKENRSKPYAIGGTSDHVHIACTGVLRLSLNDFIGRIKSTSEKYMTDSRLMEDFRWQDGYFAVTKSKSDMKRLITFIENQVGYHKDVSFKQELIRLLDENGIEYDSMDLFDFHP
jgi:REP element-mobilizing transposase RayT